MAAIKRLAVLLLALALGLLGIFGVFSLVDRASAQVGQAAASPPDAPDQPVIVVSPTRLSSIQLPDLLVTHTLWITNAGDSPLSFTLLEMTASLGAGAMLQLPLSDPLIDADVLPQLAQTGRTELILFLRQQPDLSAAALLPTRPAKARFVYQRLLQAAEPSAELYAWLEAHGTQPRRLLSAAAISATLTPAQLRHVSADPHIRRISLVHTVQLTPSAAIPPLQPQPVTLQPFLPGSVEWNIAKIRADLAWSTFNIRGQGAVVGILDTGVDYTHPALVNSYRGSLGGGSFDHNYNWFDFIDGLPAPVDPVGHGTWGAGIVSGDDGGGNQIGVAPGAQWIAVRACNTSCTDADLLAGLDWMLAPTDLLGLNPDPAKAPAVMLAMWGGSGCDGFFQPSLAALRAAGILPVFPPGGSGPGCDSIGSPADLPEALSAGATDKDDNIAIFSARGPSCYAEIKPDLSAPGVEVRTSNIGGGYITLSGTSWSAAHAAGAAALVLSTDPYLGPTDVEDILFATATCRQDLACGGDACPGANNVYGHGRIDAYEAVRAALGANPPYAVPWLTEQPVSATLAAGATLGVQVGFDSSGMPPGSYTASLGLLSDDPSTPFLSIPVTLSVSAPPVGPRLSFDPASFSETLTAGERLTDTLTLSNPGDAVLSVTLYEVTATRRLLSLPYGLQLTAQTPVDAPPEVDARLRTQLLFMGQARAIIRLRAAPDLAGALAIPDPTLRRQFVYRQLAGAASLADDLYRWLEDHRAEPRRLLTANAIAATLDAATLQGVLAFPQVQRVTINGYASLVPDLPAAPLWLPDLDHQPATVEWNIARIRADLAWSTFGIRGQGAVVGVIDTGVAYTHPALLSQYRGNLGGGLFDHNYNWFDLSNGLPAPYDDNGHGTFGMGIAVGDDGGVNQIGVAPSAQWVAVKALDAGGSTTEELLHAALQWMLAPTDLSGQNPDPTKAPDVLLNMWRWGSCEHTFDLDLAALRLANILPVFAPGGEGPGCGLVASPAASPDALSAGATTFADTIMGFSSRGPSCYDGGIKPDLAAPGENIRSSVPGGSYDVWSGTSFSTAHLAGAAALLFSADPRISIDELEQTLFATAVCHDDALYCGGDACPAPNNAYGYGRIDAFEAISQTMSTHPPFDLPWLIAGPLVVELQPAGSLQVPVIFDAAAVAPGSYTGGIGLESNDPEKPFSLLPVSLQVSPLLQRYLLPFIYK